MPYKDPAKNREKVRRHRLKNLEKYAKKQAKYYQDNPDIYLLNVSRSRAKRNSIPFNLTREDIVVPTVCPVLGIPLERGTRGFHEASPSIDRIIPDKGYTKGNIVVVSFRANKIKQNATLDELKKIVEFYQKLECESAPQSD